MRLVAINQHLGSPAPGVVVAGHAHAVRACRQYRQIIARRHIKLTVAAYPVAAFAHRAHDVIRYLRLVAQGYGHDGVKGLVHGRPRQVVHGGVNNAKAFLLARLEVQHLGHAHTCIANQRAPRLNHQFFTGETMRVNFGQQKLPQRISCGGRLIVAVNVVLNSQTATKINVLNWYACRFNAGHQLKHLVHRVQIRLGGGDL